uniref:Uncharacterized protein n=1 Tax=Candidatus Kentrum sp. FW TaxID=2126338 RepID=A0A450SA75_9GAMM|nr:MAG: conserved hypothetical protein, ribA/ribD-fused [Candidatus Kentron sp. FW]
MLSCWCSPFTAPEAYALTSVDSKRENEAPTSLDQFFLGSRYELSELLSTPAWLMDNVASLAPNNGDDGLDTAFGMKYSGISPKDDARSMVMDWSTDVYRALNHLNRKVLSGNLLHVGSDCCFEPGLFHEKPRSVTLVDISSELLESAARISPEALLIHTRAESLRQVPSSSIDFYVALRVYSSYGFQVKKAIQEAARVLGPGGSILLSIPNGYRAMDDTILPGQIVDSPPYLSFSRPFEDALDLLHLLSRNGFRELFLVPGNAELFLGGTYLPSLKSVDSLSPILHIEGFDHIPLCFYSEKMPTGWLGNYSPHPITLDGHRWPTVEHYFQSAKFSGHSLQEIIREKATPQEAKELAWQNNDMLRSDWEQVRVGVMQRALSAKFEQHPYLRKPLMETGDRKLVELSRTDTFWGSRISGEGLNTMGDLLSALRLRYRGEDI